MPFAPSDIFSRLSRLDPRVWLVLLVDLALLAPWALYSFAPCMDLPNHAAAAAVLGQLFGLFDGHGATFYAFNDGQWAPYHLAQGILLGALTLLGPIGGAKAFLGLGILLHLSALHWGVWRLGRPWFAHLVAGPLVYGANFFWGYLPMWLGTCGVILAAFALAPAMEVKGSRTSAPPKIAVAALGSAWAVASHVMWWPALMVIWGGFLGGHPYLRGGLRRISFGARRLGVGVLVLLLVVSLGWAARALAQGGGIDADWGTFEQRLWHFKRLWAPFDRGVGRASAWALLAVFFGGWALHRAGRPQSPLERYGATIAGGGLLLLAFLPLALTLGASHAWGISFRFAPLVWVGITMCVPAAAGRSIRVAALGAACAFAGALLPPWAGFDRAARDFFVRLESLPPTATVLAPHRQEPFLDFWPAVDHHLPTWHVARGGAWVSTVFAGGHAPIRPRFPLPEPDHRWQRAVTDKGRAEWRLFRKP